MILSGGSRLDFAPQALGEVTPQASSTGYFYPDSGIPLLNTFAVYGQLYRSQPWLAAVVDKVSASGARLSFNVWDNSPTSGKVLDSESSYARLWRRPCPTMPTFRFWRWTFSTYEVYGEAFWMKFRDDAGNCIGFYPMHPSRTTIERDKDTGRTTYVFTLGVASAGLLRLDEDDVVPFLRYNPDGLMRGLSRIEALRSTLYSEDASRRAIESWWKRGARPSLMISAPAALSQPAYDRLASTVSKVHGGADQMGGTLLLEEGAKPIPVQLSAEEMQYIQSRTLNREEVCGVYDVPPPVVHILDHATFTNITEQMRSMYRDTMTPRLGDIESVIDHYVRPEFDPLGTRSAEFALDEVIRGDFEALATAAGSLVEKGIMKPSEARPMFNLPDAGPVADKLYANAAIQELGAPAARISISESGPAPAEGATALPAGRAGTQGSSEAAKGSKRTRSRDERRSAARRGNWNTDTDVTEEDA